MGRSVSARACKTARNRVKCINTEEPSTITPRVTSIPVYNMTNTSNDIEAAICTLDDLRELWAIIPQEVYPEEAGAGLHAQSI